MITTKTSPNDLRNWLYEKELTYAEAHSSVTNRSKKLVVMLLDNGSPRFRVTYKCRGENQTTTTYFTPEEATEAYDNININ